MRYGKSMSEALAEIREGFSKKEIKMAIGVASDPRYKQGNYSGAVRAIEKIKKGLSKHPQVAAVLKRQNEEIFEKVKCPECNGEGCDHCNGRGYHTEALDKEDEPFVKDLIKKLRKGSATHGKQADDLEKAVKEDGHADVSSAMRQCKTITEDATQIDGKLQTMSPEDNLPTWWTNKLAVASNNMNKMRDYIVNPIQEEVELDEQMRVFRVSSGKLQGNVHAKDEKEAEKIFRKKGAKGKITITDRGPVRGRQPRLVNDFELDEALPPHLAKLFDKDGNFKDPKKQKVFDRMMGDGIGKEIAQKMGRIKFRVQADSAKKKVMVYVDQNDESDAQKALKNHPAYVSGALRVIPEAFNLEEGTWIVPDTPAQKRELKKLLSKPFPLGKEGDNAANKMYGIIGDDELFDDLYVAGKKDPKGDARPIIKKAMKRLKIKEETNIMSAYTAAITKQLGVR